MPFADTALNTTITVLNAIALDFLARIGWACVGGGVLVLIVAAFCRIVRPPAAVRAALWWLASAKFLLGLLPVVAAIALTVSVPRGPATAPFLHPLRTLSQPFLQSAGHPSPLPKRPASVVKADTTPISPGTKEAVPNEPTLARPILYPIAWLLLAYLAGLSAFVGRAIKEARNVHRTVRNAVPVDDTGILAQLNELTLSLGIRRFPALCESSAVSTPFVAGIVRPVIMLPAHFTEVAGAESVRLALLHELMHLRRGDLLLGVLPWIVRLLFWWFPLAHVACREWEQAREEACDSAVIAAAEANPLAYGRLLVQMATGDLFRGATMAGIAAPGFSPLKRRLDSLRRGPLRLSPPQKTAIALLLITISCGSLPYRVRAVLPFEQPIASFRRTVPEYEVIPLGTLGGQYSDAFGINDDGLVAGAASLQDKAGRGHAFLAQPGGEPIDLSADSDFPRSMAAAVNARGEAIATAFYRSAKPQAFFWDGKRHYVGTLPGFGYSQAAGLNDGGMAVGTALRYRRQWGAVQARAWVWQRGAMRDLGTLGGPYSHATAVNDAGAVVGKADLAREPGENGTTHAFVWDAVAGMRDLGTLPGGRNSRAQAINDAGEITGVSEMNGDSRQAFVTSDGGTMQALPSLPQASACAALSINEKGWVVGNAVRATGESRATLWVRSVGGDDAQAVDLNDRIPGDSGWHLLTARGINNRGEIVGQGEWQGKRQAFLLRPIARSKG